MHTNKNIYYFIIIITYIIRGDIMRISMSLPDELVKEFDEVLKKEGYSVRSKGIADALKEYIISHGS